MTATTDASLRAWRRLDWRFLLPALPAGILVYREGLAEDLVEALPLLRMDDVQRVTSVDWQRFGDGTVQLVVLSDPSAADLASAARVLAPSGCVYVEVRRRAGATRGPRTTLGVGRLLRSAGLRQVHPYWHAPDHSSSTRIVPLDKREAVRGTLMRYDAVRFGHFKSLLGRLALRTGLLPLAISHGSVVAYRGSPDGDGSAPNLIQRRLSAEVGAEALSGHGVRPDAALVLLTPGFPTSRHVIGLVQASAGQARVVVKLPRRPFDNVGVSWEAMVIRDLVIRAPGLQVAVPEVLALVDERHHLLLMETAVAGTVLDPGEVQAHPDDAVRAGLDFIGKLPVTRPSSTAGDDWFQTVVGIPLSRFEQHLAHALTDGADLVRRTREQLGCLASAQVPQVFEHGDLSHPNLFIDPDGGLRVIDWERSTPNGFVGLDLVFYLQYVAESRASAYARDEQVTVFRHTFLDRDGWGRALLEDHLRDRGVDAGLALEVLLASWARTACTLVDRLVPADAGTSPYLLSAGERATVREDRDVALWRCALEHLEVLRHPDPARPPW